MARGQSRAVHILLKASPRKNMMPGKKLLVFIAWVGMSVPAGTLPAPQHQPSDSGQPLQSHAGTMVAPYSFAEIASFAARAAHQTTSGVRPDGTSALGLGEPLDPNEAWAPIDAGLDARFGQAMAQRSTGPEPDGGHVPAVPEPAGWVLLLSGLAVVACIARRRTSMALM
jgi:PEP-CTERM motif-containing protein